MEANVCDINHLDADALLPPRKRLLAGLKKQNSDGNPYVASTSSCASELDARLQNLVRSQLSNPNLSTEEIMESSRVAAVEAVRVAEAARAVANEKALVAAKAVATAKIALELVATVSEETVCKERYKKNKLKKHVPVQMLYNKHKVIENCRTDEELARRLHRAMNSSPRISKNSSTSDSKNHKHKRLKRSASFEKSRVYNGSVGWEGNPSSASNGNSIAREVVSEGSNHEQHMVRVDESTSKLNKTDLLNMDNGDAETIYSKVQYGEGSEDISSLSRKRGRIKQKKLPLSICNFRDQSVPKDELKCKSTTLTEESLIRAGAGNKPLFSAGPSGDGMMGVDQTSMWKCQSFKAPACVKQNKVMQS